MKSNIETQEGELERLKEETLKNMLILIYIRQLNKNIII